MTAPESIKQLVRRFDENRDAYHSGRYNEAQLRVEFLNPLFEALGWDVYNKKDYALDYREVVTEDSIEIQGQAKAPDYAFKIGRERKFFVEAKKPSVDIAGDIHPAYQLRRYAWNVHLPLSILSDFEEFAVYDCRNRPNPNDSAATGRTMFFKYRDYVEHWDEIAGIFSREAVLKGSFDKYALENKGKKGTTEVDDAFLEDIEAWRTLLARVIALRNPNVADEQQLNYAVQMTIDRIIFLRICEDRGIEPEYQLQTIAKTPGIYSQLIELFKRADTRYNSGLFHFHAEKGQANGADTFTPALKIDDKTLKEIINRMYYPCPYIFKEIPVEILGQVYEQFLGKVIRLTAGHQAKVEEKPEVRKAGGVYYTPAYIVKYIVENTLGKLLEGKTPAEAAELKLVDPACGSGSFLLGAYQYLLNWHEDWYAAHEPEQWARGKHPALVQVNGGAWKLTTMEKKKILVNTIHGVDIDPQAVEVTKLSLLLKVLEEESGQLSLGFERVLPDLGNNIKCGNSLIGEDYFEGRLAVDESERRRVNPFDWQRAFPQVFARGGFDAVIGNPPYIRIQAMKEWAPTEVEFYKKRYISASKGNYDIYVVFVEKGLRILRNNGHLGFILPSKFFSTDYGENLREIIGKGNRLEQIVEFGHFQVFEQASTYTCLLFLYGSNLDNFRYKLAKNNIELTNPKFRIIENFSSGKRWVFSEISSETLTKKMYSISKSLGELPTRIGRGSSSGNDSIYVLKKKGDALFTKNNEKVEIEAEILRVPIFATNFGRYRFTPLLDEMIIFPYKVKDDGYEVIPEVELKRKYPGAYKYLMSNKKDLEKRAQFKVWYAFSAPRNLEVHEKAQMLVPLLADKGLYCRLSESSSTYCLMAGGGFSITVGQENGLSPNYVLGLLNSKLLFWRLKSISNIFRGGWITCTKQYVETLPIRTIDFSNPADVTRHERMVALVQRMLDLHKQPPATPFEEERLQREIQATDNEIDRLVYELYELTAEEVKIVEGG